MTDPDLDLSIPSLMLACKGNVAMLPSFMVHDDDVWPRSGVVRTDSKGRTLFDAVIPWVGLFALVLMLGTIAGCAFGGQPALTTQERTSQ